VLRALYYYRGSVTTDVDPLKVPALLREPDTLIWLDFERPTDDEIALLERTFNLHPLALEDIRTQNQRPKLDRYDGYVYLVLYALDLDEQDNLERIELDMVIGSNYVITSHTRPVAATEALQQRCQQRPELFEPHPLGFLVYHIADGLVDAYFPLVDRFEDRVDALEERALAVGSRGVLDEIFQVRKDLLQMRNVVEPSRDVFNVLARREESFLDPSTIVYFTDVYDHLLRISSLLDGLRELASGALDTHLSVQANELNVTVERLTALTLVLMGITLVTGFCGMNVQFPGRDDPSGLAIAVAFMVLAGLAGFYYSRRRGWL
jgi:magnesium transporter